MSNNINNIYKELGISDEVFAFCQEVEESLKDRFKEFDEIAEYNQLKVINAMQKENVSEACLGSSTGYGYNDLGRDTLEKVYARIFKTEDALVRPQITCGTHALALALFSNLRPGDELLSISGKPYDTLEEVLAPSAKLGVVELMTTLSTLAMLSVGVEVVQLATNVTSSSTSHTCALFPSSS